MSKTTSKTKSSKAREIARRALIPGYGIVKDYTDNRKKGYSTKASLNTALKGTMFKPAKSSESTDLLDLGSNIVKMILGGNDEKWYTRFGKPTPARNLMRPTNPVYITDVTSQPAMGGLSKHVEVVADWESLWNSQAFDTAIFKLMEAIRMDLRSNLPYSIEKLKAYVHNTISLSIFIKQIERQLRFTRFVDPQDPQFVNLWNKVVSNPDIVGFSNLLPLYHYMSESEGGSLSNTISMYNIAVEMAKKILVLPGALSQFIEHYAGNLFCDSNDANNTQYLSLRFRRMPLASYDERSDSSTINYISILDLNIDTFLELLNQHMITFSVVNADTLKATTVAPLHYYRYEDLKPEVMYDPSFIQAIINGYTSSEAITEDGYVKFDQFAESNDEYTQFIFAGAIQPDLTGTIGSPLITIVSQAVKYQSNEQLNWPTDLFQSEIVDTSHDFALNIRSLIEADTTVNVSATDANFTSTSNPTEPIALASNGITALTDMRVEGTININYDAPLFGTNATDSDTKILYYMLPIMRSVVTTSPFGGSSSTTIKKYWMAYKIERSQTGLKWESNDGITITPMNKIYRIEWNGSDVEDKYTRIIVREDELLGSNKYVIRAEGNQATVLSGIGSSTSVTISEIDGSLTGQSSSDITLKFPASSQSYRIAVDFNRVNPITYVLRDYADYNTLNSNYQLSIQPNNTTYTVDGIVATLGVFYATLAGTLSNLESVSTKRTLLSAFIADQLDYHIPFVHRNRVNLNVNGTTGTERSQDILVKENYVPYFYNVNDLIPLSYEMIFSLIAPQI